MHIINPCCAKKDLMMLRDALGKSGTRQFEGYGDLSLTELLPALLTRYSETEMMIVAPSLPDQAAEVIARWMKRQWARMDGKGRLDVISHLTIVADMDAGKSPLASGWLSENPFGGCLTLCDRKQADTAILLPDFVITGPVNMQYGHRFTATATTDPARVADAWRQFASLASPEETAKTEEAEEHLAAKEAQTAGGRRRRPSFRR